MNGHKTMHKFKRLGIPRACILIMLNIGILDSFSGF